MKRLLSVMIGIASLGVYGGLPAYAQDPVADRAVAGAKEYVKAKNLKDPKLTILLSSLYNTSFPDFAKKWEELTGVKFEIVPLGYTDIPAKIMQEAVSKTGVYDIFNDFPYTMPDAAGAKVILRSTTSPKNTSRISRASRRRPAVPAVLRRQALQSGQRRRPSAARLRKDLMENPQVSAEYKAKFSKDLGCPDTIAEWEQQAAFFQRQEGETRWGIKFEKGLSGALGYRSVNFSYRHFPAYMKGLLFDKDMKPRITTPDGIQAIKDFAASVEYMPKDIQGWGTPQIYPFWGSGQAYSAVSFPSIFGFGESNPTSVVKGKQIACLIPGHMVDGKLVRRSPQAAGTGYMVSAYAKNPELAYLFIQWLTSPSIGDEAVAHPKGFWDPFRASNLTQPRRSSIGSARRWSRSTIENSKYAASLLLIEGDYEYFKILDNNLADVMNKNISAEEAAKRIEAELEQDDQRHRPGAPDPRLAQRRREGIYSTSSEISIRCHPEACPRDPLRHIGAHRSRNECRGRQRRFSRHPRLPTMAETTAKNDLADARRNAPGAFGRLGRWLASERVFRLIPFRDRRGAVRSDHTGPIRADDLDQPAEMARQSAVRDGPLRRLRELRGSARQRPVLAGARPHVLFRWRRRGARADHRLRAGHAGDQVHAIAAALYDDIPGADDDRADRRRLQLLDDLYRQRAAQSAAGAVLERFGIDPRIRWLSHPIAAQWGDHHRRRLAVDVSDVPDFPVRLCRPAASTRQRRPRDGRHRPGRSSGASQLPLLKPAIVIAVIIRSMEALKLFDPVVLLTFGGPGTSTQTVAYFLWEQVWVFNKFSFGAAASIMLLFMFSVLIFFGDLHADQPTPPRSRGQRMAVNDRHDAGRRPARRPRLRRNGRGFVRHAILLAWTALHRLPDLLDGLDLVQGCGRVGDLAAALAAA